MNFSLQTIEEKNNAWLKNGVDIFQFKRDQFPGIFMDVNIETFTVKVLLNYNNKYICLKLKYVDLFPFHPPETYVYNNKKLSFEKKYIFSEYIK